MLKIHTLSQYHVSTLSKETLTVCRLQKQLSLTDITRETTHNIAIYDPRVEAREFYFERLIVTISTCLQF